MVIASDSPLNVVITLANVSETEVDSLNALTYPLIFVNESVIDTDSDIALMPVFDLAKESDIDIDSLNDLMPALTLASESLMLVDSDRLLTAPLIFASVSDNDIESEILENVVLDLDTLSVIGYAFTVISNMALSKIVLSNNAPKS